MGRMRYGAQDYEFDDRLLAHLQILIAMKLRRSESFFINWQGDPVAGEGRRAIWVDNGIPIQFLYSGSRPSSINRDWLEAMASTAHSNIGMQISREEDAPSTE